MKSEKWRHSWQLKHTNTTTTMVGAATAPLAGKIRNFVSVLSDILDTILCKLSTTFNKMNEICQAVKHTHTHTQSVIAKSIQVRFQLFQCTPPIRRYDRWQTLNIFVFRGHWKSMFDGSHCTLHSMHHFIYVFSQQIPLPNAFGTFIHKNRYEKNDIAFDWF